MFYEDRESIGVVRSERCLNKTDAYTPRRSRKHNVPLKHRGFSCCTFPRNREKKRSDLLNHPLSEFQYAYARGLMRFTAEFSGARAPKTRSLFDFFSLLYVAETKDASCSILFQIPREDRPN